MKRYLIIALLLVVALASNKTVNATPISWVLSPDANALATSVTVVVGLGEINFAELDSQPTGIYGAGFTTFGTSAKLIFDADLNTWDSYNDGSIGVGTGYFDAFIVTISTTGYYWTLGLGDPIATTADTWVWGGDTWGDGILETYITAPSSTTDMVEATSTFSTMFFYSIVLDTKTSPDSDTSYPSWGSFHVSQPIPEPGTIALLGIGLAGLVGVGVRKRAKKNAA